MNLDRETDTLKKVIYEPPKSMGVGSDPWWITQSIEIEVYRLPSSTAALFEISDKSANGTIKRL